MPAIPLSGQVGFDGSYLVAEMPLRRLKRMDLPVLPGSGRKRKISALFLLMEISIKVLEDNGKDSLLGKLGNIEKNNILILMANFEVLKDR